MANQTVFDYETYLSAPPSQAGARPLSQFTALLRALKVKRTPDYRCIHIAGTNGKGSTSAILASILQEAGWRTGLYTSPALVRVNERFQIDGAEVDEETLRSAAERVAQAEQKLGIAFGGFDRMTAAALLLFQEAGLDAVVLETGMGGRLDPTNAMHAVISMITSIALDHAEILGDTLRKITREKAAIVKKGQHCCIVHPQGDEVMKILAKRSQTTGVPLVCIGDVNLRGWRVDPLWQEVLADTSYGVTYQYKTSLRGAFQWANVVAAAVCARQLGIDAVDVSEGVKQARWPGRMEQLDGYVPVLLDGAHNPDGMQALVEVLREWYPQQSVVWIGAIRCDKDYRRMVDTMKDSVEIFLPVSSGAGFVDARELAQYARSQGIPAQESQSLKLAFDEATKFCDSMEEKFPLILATGSLHFVGEVRHMLLSSGEYFPALERPLEPEG